MDCIFKAWGYVPKHRFCTKCEPLENILKSLGHDDKKTSKAIDRIFRAYTIMKADDVLRDEKSMLKKAAAKLVKKLCGLKATEELRRMIGKADRTIRDLEASQADAEEYVRKISFIGGEVFQMSVGDEHAFPIGRTLSAVTTIHDMAKDLEEDERKGLFNPLRYVPLEKITITAANLQAAFFGSKPLLEGGLQTRAFSPQVVLASGGFWETCFGVCAGICSAIALYRCCCE